MRYVWPAWLVFCCLATLLSLVRPKNAANEVSRVVTLLGLASFVGWLTNGGFLLCFALGVAIAYPSLCAIFLVFRPAGRDPLPPGYARVFARRAAIPSLVWGALIGLAFGLGGRLTGSTFVVWRACLGGALVWLAGGAWLWQLRGTPLVAPSSDGEGGGR